MILKESFANGTQIIMWRSIFPFECYGSGSESMHPCMYTSLYKKGFGYRRSQGSFGVVRKAPKNKFRPINATGRAILSLQWGSSWLNFQKLIFRHNLWLEWPTYERSTPQSYILISLISRDYIDFSRTSVEASLESQ